VMARTVLSRVVRLQFGLGHPLEAVAELLTEGLV
jgi:hypothetical protein